MSALLVFATGVLAGMAMAVAAVFIITVATLYKQDRQARETTRTHNRVLQHREELRLQAIEAIRNWPEWEN